MSATEKVIDDLNVAKFMLGNTQITLTRELRVRIGLAITSAINLLTEQKAEQPIVHENSYGWKFYYCPKCKQEFYQNRKQAYCDKCGKAVKWDDEE